jgi:hypothetical protein
VRRAEHFACRGQRRRNCRVLIRKTEGKRPLCILRSRWESIIEKEFRNKVENMDWVHLAQNRAQ